MQKRNLHASLYFFDGREPPEVRKTLARALHCNFDEEFAKSDEFRTTWFADSFGFEIAYYLVSRRDDGAWYTVNIGPSSGLADPDAPMEEIDFHLFQILQNAGFSTVVTAPEYFERHHTPAS
jgi:hypothetical protein